MAALNSIGEVLGRIEGVTAMTDITGFGFLGHLLEMTAGSKLSAEIIMQSIPVFPFLDEYLQKNLIPDNTYRNWNSYEKRVQGVNDMRSFQLLNDPQTSGGLLVAVRPGAVAEVVSALTAAGLAGFAEPVGKLTETSTFEVSVIL
jgi:selenide,water dikinase